MKNLKIFPKMFLHTFVILWILIVFIHLLVYLIFPKTYLETRKQEIYMKANELSNNLQGKDLKFIQETLEFYSKSSEIKAFIKGWVKELVFSSSFAYIKNFSISCIKKFWFGVLW